MCTIHLFSKISNFYCRIFDFAAGSRFFHAIREKNRAAGAHVFDMVCLLSDFFDLQFIDPELAGTDVPAADADAFIHVVPDRCVPERYEKTVPETPVGL